MNNGQQSSIGLTTGVQSHFAIKPTAAYLLLSVIYLWLRRGTHHTYIESCVGVNDLLIMIGVLLMLLPLNY